MKVVLQNLTKIFPSRDKKAGKEVVAVNDFTFEIPDGKLIGLLGPSGCGKSTLGRNIIRLQDPTAGQVIYDGKDITDLNNQQMKNCTPNNILRSFFFPFTCPIPFNERRMVARRI